MADIIGDQPILRGPETSIGAEMLTELQIRYRIDASATPTMDILWYVDGAYNSGQTMNFPIVIDNEWHNVTVDLSSNFTWQGTVTWLRLSPVGQPATSGGQVEIDYIRICS